MPNVDFIHLGRNDANTAHCRYGMFDFLGQRYLDQNNHAPKKLLRETVLPREKDKEGVFYLVLRKEYRDSRDPSLVLAQEC